MFLARRTHNNICPVVHLAGIKFSSHDGSIKTLGREGPSLLSRGMPWLIGSSFKFETQTSPSWSALLSLVFYELNHNSYPENQADLLLAPCDFITRLTLISSLRMWSQKFSSWFMAHTPDMIILIPQGPESMMLPTLEMVMSAVPPKLPLSIYSIASTNAQNPRWAYLSSPYCAPGT